MIRRYSSTSSLLAGIVAILSKIIMKVKECDQWLSTRSKSKIAAKQQKPLKRRSISLKKTSSGTLRLTQNSPPPPQLKTATKQSTVTSFFRPVSVVGSAEELTEDNSLVDVENSEKRDYLQQSTECHNKTRPDYNENITEACYRALHCKGNNPSLETSPTVHSPLRDVSNVCDCSHRTKVSVERNRHTSLQSGTREEVSVEKESLLTAADGKVQQESVTQFKQKYGVSDTDIGLILVDKENHMEDYGAKRSLKRKLSKDEDEVESSHTQRCADDNQRQQMKRIRVTDHGVSKDQKNDRNSGVTVESLTFTQFSEQRLDSSQEQLELAFRTKMSYTDYTELQDVDFDTQFLLGDLGISYTGNSKKKYSYLEHKKNTCMYEESQIQASVDEEINTCDLLSQGLEFEPGNSCSSFKLSKKQRSSYSILSPGESSELQSLDLEGGSYNHQGDQSLNLDSEFTLKTQTDDHEENDTSRNRSRTGLDVQDKLLYDTEMLLDSQLI